MNRFLCIWLPNWPIHRLVVEQPELSNKPIILHTRDSRQRQIVAACSSKAKALGVSAGMLLADASTMVEGKHFVVQPHDVNADQEAITVLAEWSSQFSPLVSIDSPDSLYFDLAGVTHLYGDEPALVNHVDKAFRTKGYRPRIAIANTPSAAWATAHYSKTWRTIVPQAKETTLLTLPVEALRLPDETLAKLDRLGIHRIEQLVDLPRQSLPSRIGQDVIDCLDLLIGNKIESLCNYKPLPTFEQQWRLDQATDHWETICHIVHTLLQRLSKQLHCHSHGANHLTICLDCTNNQATKIAIGLYRASADASRFDELARMRLDATKLLAPVECITVVADKTEALEQQQHSLLSTENHVNPREVADLVERLSSRLGDDRVVKALLVDDWQPEQAFRYQSLTQSLESPITTRSVSEGLRQSHRPPMTIFDSPEGTAVYSLGRQPQVSKDKMALSPEGATQQTELFSAAPSGLCGGIPPQNPGANAPGYMLSPLRGWGRANSKNAGETDSSLTLRVEMRPLRMFFPPEPIEIVAKCSDGSPTRLYYHGEQRVANYWGPERLETAWWRGPWVKRDYYHVETELASRFWIFRCLHDGKWFLHGSFD